jgi:integrase
MAGVSAVYDREGEHIGWKVSVRKKGFPPQFKTFRTKAEALAWAAVVESEMVRGVWRDRSESESTTLGDCFDRYAKEVLPYRKDGGRRGLSFLLQWKKRPIASRFMASIRGEDVAACIKEMEAEGKSANTIRIHLALLSHLFTVARKEWGMENLSNPVELVRKPRLPQGRDRRLVADEEKRLLDTCNAMNPEIAAVVRIAIETGMRQGEIMGMTWDKVDVKRRTVLLDETKNGTRRIVPLSSAAVGVLEALPRRIDGKVWTYTQDGLKAMYRKAVARASITGLTFHDLRHEAASRLFEKGLNPMQVAAITGHKTLQMLKRYTHLRAEDLAKLLG